MFFFIFLVGEEGWRLANPKPKLVSSLEREVTTPPNLKRVWGLGRGNYPSKPQTSLGFGGEEVTTPQTKIHPLETGVGGSLKKLRFPTTLTQRQQSCRSASICPSISSVSTEQYRIGVKNLLTRFQILMKPAQRNLLRNWMTSRNPESHPMLRQSSRIHLRPVLQYREICCVITKKDSNIFQ